MDATRIGWRLLVTGLLGLLCTGCTPTLSVRDLSMDEPQHDRSNGVGERSARLAQTTASKSKPGLASAAAARTMEAAEGRSEDVLTRVRLTYYDLLKARRELETMEFLVDSSEKALQAAESLEKRSAGYGHDAESATDELEPYRLMKVAVMRVKAAELNMLRVLERSSLAPNHLAKRSKGTDQILVDFEWQTMLASLRDSSTELQAARALIADQERLLTEATARLWASKAVPPKPAMPLPKVTAVPPKPAMPLPKVTAAPPMRAMPLPEGTAAPPLLAIPQPEVTAAPPMRAMPMTEVTAAPQISAMPLPAVTAAPQILEMPLPKVTATPQILEMPLPKVTAAPQILEMPLPKVTAAPPMRAMPLPKGTAAPPLLAMPQPEVTAAPPNSAMPLPEVTAAPQISAMPLPKVTAAPQIPAMPLPAVTAAPQILEMPLHKVTAVPQILEMPLPKVTAAPPIAAMPLRKVAAELLFQDEVRIRLVPVAQEGDAGPSAGAGQVLILPVISQGAERQVEK